MNLCIESAEAPPAPVDSSTVWLEVLHRRPENPSHSWLRDVAVPPGCTYEGLTKLISNVLPVPASRAVLAKYNRRQAAWAPIGLNSFKTPASKKKGKKKGKGGGGYSFPFRSGDIVGVKDCAEDAENTDDFATWEDLIVREFREAEDAAKRATRGGGGGGGGGHSKTGGGGGKGKRKQQRRAEVGISIAVGDFGTSASEPAEQSGPTQADMDSDALLAAKLAAEFEAEDAARIAADAELARKLAAGEDAPSYIS